MVHFHIRYFLILVLLLVSSCDSGANDDDRVVAGVDLDELYAPATAAEIQATLDDWAQRDVSVQNLVEVARDTLGFAGGKQGLARIVSHDVAGVTHYGAIVEPLNPPSQSLPVLVYTHGGELGETLDATLTFLSLGISDIIDQFVFVVPSFRDEPLTLNGVTYQSEGPASPWDYDVDDALALLNAALETTPAADPARIGVFGFSRGAGVSLLMAIRDPRIDLVSEFFGPTDFFVQDVQDTITEALRGEPRDLPGLNFLNETYIQPLRAGTISVDDARIQMIRRSPVLFADLLPAVQIQHGQQDNVVNVDHATVLAQTLQDLGRTSDEFEIYLYGNAGHNPIEMIGSFDRLVEFVQRLLEVPA